ncbi:MAG: 6-phosphofructokinase [Campylobacterales bacterium]|nr:6-phosphofructokinase [Campylobacterales bacterium]
MNIAIFTSGGDCSGMNPAIKTFVEECYMRGITPYLIYDGLEGLIDDSIKKAEHSDVSRIIYRGGTVLRSSRSKRFFEKEYRVQAYENLKRKDIKKLIVLGGDGSFRALDAFHDDFGIDFIGIPSTIDNDIYGTDYCLGVDTALNVIRRAIDEIRDTAASFKRAFVIETMGRECGYLALVSALTCGAEVCIIPELEFDLQTLGERLKKEVNEGRNYAIAITAEGSNMSEKVEAWFENEIGLESRISKLGHIQRGGNPTVFDRLIASEFVINALDRLIQTPNTHHAIVYKNSTFDFIAIDTVSSGKYTIKPELLKMGQALCR